VAAEDRTFAAAEMTAFLVAWLSGLASLGLPIFNPPTPSCLNGPGWRPEHWAVAAARAGLRVRPVVRAIPSFLDGSLPKGEEVPRSAGPDPIEVVVVGYRVIDRIHPSLASLAVRLARSARTPLLAVRFEGDRPDAAFAGASPWPDLRREGLIEALEDAVRDGARRSVPGTRVAVSG
jgi:hypothetical protein